MPADPAFAHLPPPVPAECDLRSFPYLPLDVVRLRDSRLSATATGDEFRAAVLLWCASWHQVPAGSLPTDDRELASLAGYGRDLKGWAKVRSMAMHGWVEHADHRLYHAVIAEKAAEAWRQRQVQKAKADKRWLKAAAPDAGTPGEDAAGDATALPAASAPAMQQIQNRTDTEQNREENPSTPSSSSGSQPRDGAPAAAGGGARHRVSSINAELIRKSCAQGDLLGIVHGFRANTAPARTLEWLRDCGDRQFAAVIAIFWGSHRQGRRIREPSGFRDYAATWDTLPLEDRRSATVQALDALEIPHSPKPSE